MREAAGITAVAHDTGRFLLLRRSRDVNRPHLWACPAGRLDPGEAPMEAAVREFREETEYDGHMLVDFAGSSQEKKRIFHHFVAVVPNEFEPWLNWENDDYGWFTLDGLPSPLHPGMRDLLEAW